MKIFFMWFLFLTNLPVAGYAQLQTVAMDYQENELNGNQPLPAEEFFIISGSVSPEISLVKLDILNNRHGRDTFYTAAWRRPWGNTSAAFSIPVRYKLRGNDQYDFVFTFYRSLSDSDRVRFATAVYNNLDSYIRSTLETNRSRLALRSSANRMRKDMNGIVQQAFTYYRNGLPGSFPGFSDLVKNKLKQIDDARLRNAQYNVQRGKEDDKADIRRRYAGQLQKELLEMAMNEVMPYINNSLVVFLDKREMKGFPTEKTRTLLAVDVGYGGVYLSGDWGDLSYDAQPYIGLSFPLGNRHFTRFGGNASVSAGIFLQNFKDEHNKKITGPVIGKPFYLGLGYKVFRFIRINGGVVATSTDKSTLQDVKFEDVKLKPFIGLSAELNLWLGTER